LIGQKDVHRIDDIAADNFIAFPHEICSNESTVEFAFTGEIALIKRSHVLKAWGRILTGHYPSLSIEITRECPLRCPGCYAYEPEHLGQAGPLRSLADFKSQELIDGVLKLVDEHRPLHVSIVGGEPLVRFRELNTLMPILAERGIAVQLVTSAVRPIPIEWATIPDFHLCVSIDGLQADHDVRRKPATYKRIIENIKGHRVTVHCTITRQMTHRPDYFEEFLDFWTPKDEVKRVWFSIFTPQRGASDEEILTQEERVRILDELAAMRSKYPKLDLMDSVIRGYKNPPASPQDCIFSKTTINYTADLKSRIAPCQFGGDPDCSQCGCMASAALNAVGTHKLFGAVPVGAIFRASSKVGDIARAATGSR
jgi:sulfatase maturation enzyme AslB (radical SAM superfamily)